MTHLTKPDLVRGFRDLGLSPSDIVFVHSALSTLGHVEGGADTLIDALMEAVGPEGTVVMPTFGTSGVFDRDQSPTGLGTVPEIFRRREGVLRSLHPTASVAAYGPKAEEIVQDHVRAETAHAEGTPYKRIADRGGYVMLIGVDQDRSTMLHTVEALAEAAYLSERDAPYLDEERRPQTAHLSRLPGPHRDFIGLDRRFREAGVMRIARIGDAMVRLLDARAMLEEGLRAFAEDPAAVLCDNPNCADCVRQRGGIRAARLAEETFTLSVDAGLAGVTLDEILVRIEGAGISHLEFGRLGNREIVDVSDRELALVKEQLTEAGVTVSAIRTAKWESATERMLEVARRLEAAYIVLPLYATMTDAMHAVGNAGPKALLDNAGLSSATCFRVLSEIASDRIRLAFNPFRFAQVYEKPFLQSYRKKLRRFTGQVYINDGTFDGRQTPPGIGNAEIKELMSIFRCTSFDGYFTLTGDSRVGSDFATTAGRFWHLLDTM